MGAHALTNPVLSRLPFSDAPTRRVPAWPQRQLRQIHCQSRVEQVDLQLSTWAKAETPLDRTGPSIHTTDRVTPLSRGTGVCLPLAP